MKQSLVSVIIPTHDRGPLLDEAIRSVLAQTYQPLEVIVVDDGSTDDTRERVLTYGPPVRYIYQSNRGPAAVALAADPDAVVYCWWGYMDQDGNVLPQAERPVFRDDILPQVLGGKSLPLDSRVHVNAGS